MEVYKGHGVGQLGQDAPDFLTYQAGAKAHLDPALDCRDGREAGFRGAVRRTSGSSRATGNSPPRTSWATRTTSGHRSVDLIGIGPSAGLKREGPPRQRDGEGAARLGPTSRRHGVHSAIMPQDWEFLNTYQNNPVVAEYCGALKCAGTPMAPSGTG